MPPPILFPLEIIKPNEILSRYSEWIYFILLFFFFSSIAGITLKKHFAKAYIKPLITSVAFILTVGVFKFRDSVQTIFEGWGILGTILLGFIAATIPYGLCRGFGMPSRKAFYLTYVLFYIISWIKFPGLYYGLAERNLGLVNLALLIFCIFSAYKIIKFGKSPRSMAEDLANINPFKPDIEREIEEQDKEKHMIKSRAKKITAIELHTIDDIASEMAQIQKIIEADKNSISGEDRQRIARVLKDISDRENIFKNAVLELKKTFQRIEVMDAGALQELKRRLDRVSGTEKHVLKKEIDREKEKLRIERAIIDFQTKIDQHLYSFNESLGAAIEKIRGLGYPYDAVPHIAKARVILKDLSAMVEEMKAVENKLIHLIHIEKKLLKKEKARS